MAMIVSCTVHGRCTEFAKPIEGIKACVGCNDRVPVVVNAFPSSETLH